jgi:hypothetical protein
MISFFMFYLFFEKVLSLLNNNQHELNYCISKTNCHSKTKIYYNNYCKNYNYYNYYSFNSNLKKKFFSNLNEMNENKKITRSKSLNSIDFNEINNKNDLKEQIPIVKKENYNKNLIEDNTQKYIQKDEIEEPSSLNNADYQRKLEQTVLKQFLITSHLR